MGHYGLERKNNLRIALFILILLLGAPATAQVVVPGQAQFRYFVWGVSPADVTKFETAKYYKTDGDSVYFLERLEKRDFRRVIRYDFQDGLLWRGQYEFQELTYPDPTLILNMYEDIKRQLVGVYGDPVQDDYFWKDKKYLNHPDYWPRALRMGDLRMKTVWEIEGTKATLILERSEPNYNLVYTAEKFDPKEKPKPQPLLNLQPAPVEESKIPDKGLPPPLFRQ